MNTELSDTDQKEEINGIDQDTYEEEVEIETFLSEIKKEEINIKSKQEKKEINDTYNENLDKARQNESIDDLKNIEWKKNIEYSVPLQKWRGHIIKLEDNSFLAELEDLTEGGTKEIAKFETREVHPSERELISRGAVFYYYIAYATKSGTLSKKSVLKFQKPIKWKVKNFDYASDRAKELAEFFKNKKVD